MEFIKERCYTALNADQVKLGSTVVLADNLADLKQDLINGNTGLLSKVYDEEFSCRFVGSKGIGFALCYLVEEPPEKKALKWTDLKLGDRIRHGDVSLLVTGIDSRKDVKGHIFACGVWYSDETLSEWEKVED